MFAMDAEEVNEPPQKRAKIMEKAPRGDGLSAGLADSQVLKEVEVGITHFVNPDIRGFSGTIKKR
jgi:hypothetical protein